MKRYLIFIIFLLSFFIFFQSTPFYSHLEVGGVSPDLLLIILSIGSFILGPISGEIIGFIAGFIVDILSGGLLGISAFTYTLIGYGVGLVGKKIYGGSILFSVILLFGVTLFKAIILSVLAGIFLKPGYFGYFSQGRVFLEAVINGLIAPVFFIFITRIQKKLVE